METVLRTEFRLLRKNEIQINLRQLDLRVNNLTFLQATIIAGSFFVIFTGFLLLELKKTTLSIL